MEEEGGGEEEGEKEQYLAKMECMEIWKPELRWGSCVEFTTRTCIVIVVRSSTM